MTTDPVERRTGDPATPWRQLLESAPEAYVAVDAHARVVDWNLRAAQVFGFRRDEALGLPVAGLVAERHRPAASRLPELLRSLQSDQLRSPLDLDAVHRDGHTFPVQCTVWGVERRGGTVVHVLVRDATDRRRADETAALLAAVVEGNADAIVTQDLAGTILTWNAGAQRLHGWSAEHAVGRDVSLIVPVDKRDELEQAVLRLGRGERVGEMQSERLTRGGIRVPVALRVSPVHDPGGHLVAVSTMARDVTEQRWMAETLDSTLAALQTAADEARASADGTRRFLADAAHQLRTPMAGISACAQTLLRGASTEDADRLLATMVRETSRAARLISSLLQMARLDQGLPATPAPVDVLALCADEVERLTLLAPDLDVGLDAQQAPGVLLLDGEACREVLSNLGDNARRHARSRVRVRVRVDDTVRILVADDGPGVAVEDRERIFERFVSLDGRGGSGLGLPIARALARTMDGDLAYADGFLLTLPAQPVASPSDAARASG